MSNTEKKILIQEIRNHDIIWDLSNENHFNINEVTKAWKTISEAVKKPCKFFLHHFFCL